MGRVGTRAVGVVVALSLVMSACGSGSDGASGDDRPPTAPTEAPRTDTTGDDDAPGDEQPSPVTTAPSSTDADAPVPRLVEGGSVSDAALAAALTDDGRANVEALRSFTAEFAELPLDQQEALLAELALRTELEAAEISGLADAVGSREATEAAIAGATAQVRSQSDAAVAALEQPAGFRRGTDVRGAASPPSGGAVAAVGLFMGYIALATFGVVATKSSNDVTPGDTDVRDRDGTVVGASVDEVDVELTFSGQQDGVDVEFVAGAAIRPCPGPDGTFTIEAVIDVRASKGGVGQNARMELKVDGTVGDDAELAGKNIETRTQWSDFGGGRGQFIDVTLAGPTGVEQARVNRTGGRVTDGFAQASTVLSTLVALLISTQLLDAAEQAWKSGRCVELRVTPSAGPDGLTPSQVVDVLAEPRSKVDGSPTGGDVTATLSAGGASVDPNGSPLPADADTRYTAPGEVDASGTVSYESRSRRGVGTAAVTFTTSKPAAYLVVGGLEDWQVDQVVCDVTKPFTLTSPGIGVAEFSGGLSGTYSVSGVFNLQYSGTYEITLENGLGTPGSMVASSGGSIAGEAGSGSENYSLTPATC